MTDIKTPKERRAELVAALRSGNYEQCREALCRITEDGAKSFCCLGVASVLFEPAKTTVRTGYLRDGHLGVWGDEYDRNTMHLTPEIKNAYGFTDGNGQFFITEELKNKFPLLAKIQSPSLGSLGGKAICWLTTLNDAAGWSFKEIADLIEYEPEGMFVS